MGQSSKAYREALDLRLQYSVVEAFTGYFTVRRILWQGEKHAMEWLAVHDPAFLALFHRHVRANTQSERMSTYEELVHVALEPVGGPWGAGVTTPGMSAGFDEPAINAALVFWAELMEETRGAGSEPS